MSDLTEFLLARIAEDEAAARKYDEELAREFGTPSELRLSSELTLAGSGYMDYPVLAIDSTRVLAGVARDRRIVEFHAPFECSNVRCPTGLHCQTCDEGWLDDFGTVHHPCPTLRALASVYADHPDYREEWRP